MKRLLRHNKAIRRVFLYTIALFALFSIAWRTPDPNPIPIVAEHTTGSTPDMLMLLECDKAEQSGAVEDCRYGQFGAIRTDDGLELYAYWMSAELTETGETISTGWMVYVRDGEVVKVE